jgi:hypothetical protein
MSTSVEREARVRRAQLTCSHRGLKYGGLRIAGSAVPKPEGDAGPAGTSKNPAADSHADFRYSYSLQDR